MKKSINTKDIIIVVLCITIIFLGIGFIFLSVNFTELKNTKSDYDLRFLDVTNISTVSGGSTKPSGDIKIEKGGKLLNMNFILYNARDELDYNISIQNNGTISGKVIDLIESPEYANGQDKNRLLPISITYSDVSDVVLEPGDATTIKLTVFYNSSTITGKKSFNYKLGLLTK